MTYFFYDIGWLIFSFLFFPLFIVYTIISGRKREGLLNFFGCIKKNEIERLNPNKKTLWIHAISIGEVKAVTPLLKNIRSLTDSLNIVISTTTESGYQEAKKTLADADIITYSPFDMFLTTGLMFKKIKPSLVIVTETGLWPNILKYANKYNACPMLIHGRISEKSFNRYIKIKPVINSILGNFKTIYMQNETGVKQLIKIGISKDKIKTVGDIKYDILDAPNVQIKEEYTKKFSIKKNSITIIAGSTHEGEEEVLIDIFKQLKEKYKLLLILAPRRLERVSEIESIIKKMNLLYEKRTTMQEGSRKNDIVILDTMGELSKIYTIGDIIFVGKSLFPPGGGHSLIEPAAFGKAVFHGNYVEYNKHASVKLKEAGIAINVDGKDDMLKKIERLLKDPSKIEEIEKKALIFIDKNKGASKKLSNIILEALK